MAYFFIVYVENVSKKETIIPIKLCFSNIIDDKFCSWILCVISWLVIL